MTSYYWHTFLNQQMRWIAVFPICRKSSSLIIFVVFTITLAGCLPAEFKIPPSSRQDGRGTEKSVAGKEVSGKDNAVIEFPEDSRLLSQLKLVPAELHTLDVIIQATGQLQANANAVTRISSPITGKVNKVLVTVGDQVRAGATLAVLSSQEIATLENELFKSETDMDSELSKDLLDIDCDVQIAEAQLFLYKKQFERQQVLQAEKIAALASVETAKTELAKQELTLQALKQKRERTIRVAEQKKRQAKQALEQRLLLFGMQPGVVKKIITTNTVETSIPIITPHGGIVLERSINIGEIVDPSKILFIIDDIDTLWLVADIFEQDIDKVQAGQNISFTVDSFPKEIFYGRLDFVAGTMNQETRTLPVRAEITNVGLKLKPKMFARMKIFADKKTTLCVPSSAIQDAGSKKVVYIPIGKNKFREQVVRTGDEAAGLTEIIAGLKEKESVVAEGAFLLRAALIKKAY